jgi:protoheme IX farnesyltransferase
MKYRSDYEAAGVPMLPVVSDRISVGRQIVLYSYAMVASTLLIIPIEPMGWIYTATALAGGTWFIVEAHVLLNQAKRDEINNPMRLFHFSISYLTALFIAIGLDPLWFLPLT